MGGCLASNRDQGRQESQYHERRSPDHTASTLDDGMMAGELDGW
jgi:hypothetical protein